MAFRVATTTFISIVFFAANVYGAAHDCGYNSSQLGISALGFKYDVTKDKADECLHIGRTGLDGGSAWPFWRQLQLLPILEDIVSAPETKNGGTSAVNMCRHDLHHYLDGLGNFSLWAVRMWDSSAQTLRGALWGELMQLGNFDECLALEEAQQDTDLGEDVLEPSYCLAKISISSQDDFELTDQLKGSAWQRIKRAKGRLELSRHATEMAMCLPASCTGQILASVLRPTLSKIGNKHGFKIEVQVPEDACQTRQTVQQDSNMPTFMLLVIGAYVAWLAMCLVFDDGRSPHIDSIFGAFSVSRQWKRLLEVTGYRYQPDRPASGVESGRDSEDISVLHGLRVLCVVIVLLGHRGEALSSGPLLNGRAIQEMYVDPWNLPVLNGSLVVDIFFVMSGLLLSWSVLGRLRKGQAMSTFLQVSLRYLRLTPALAVVVALQALVVPALGSGPLWRRLALREADRCHKYWWTNLLHINNIVHADTPCIDPLWYIACDSQLFLVSLITVQWLYRKPEVHKKFLMWALLLAMFTPAAVTAALGLDPTVIPDPQTIGHTASTIISQAVYVASYCRAGPYIVGLALGYWLHSVRRLNNDPTLQMSKVSRSLLGWAAFVAFISSLFGIALFYPPMDTLTPRIVAVIYAGVHRTLFACAVAVFIGAAATGRGGVLAKYLSVPWVRPLSRLSYCVYLVHSSIQLLGWASVRTPQVLSTSNSILMTVPDIFLALLGALVLHLTIEGPITSTVINFGPKKPRRTCSESEIPDVDKINYFKQIEKVRTNEDFCKGAEEITDTRSQ